MIRTGFEILPGQVIWQSWRAWPLVAALAVSLAVAVVWLYPAQVRLLRWPWRWVLPGLRAAALLALAAALLQPVAIRPRTAEERGVLLVLIDRSRSMSVVDTDRSKAQLVALADGLGRLPAGARPAAAGELAGELEQLRGLVDAASAARLDLDYARLSGRGVPQAEARATAALGAYRDAAQALAARAADVLPQEAQPRHDVAAKLAALREGADGTGDGWAADALARIAAAGEALAAVQAAADEKLYASDEGIRQVCEELAGLSRFRLVEQALTRPGSGLLARMVKDTPVIGFGVADDVSALGLSRGGEPRDNLAIEPDGLRSHLSGAPQAAMRQVGARGLLNSSDAAAAAAPYGRRPVRAVVLFSDGRQVGAEGSMVSGVTAGAGGVPVYAVWAAAPAEPRQPDVSLTLEQMPSSAFVGETVTVLARVKAVGQRNGGERMAARAADVRLVADGGAGELDGPAPADTPPSGAPGSGGPDVVDEATGSAEFSVKFDEPGVRRVVLSAPMQDGEVTGENNRLERWVKVSPQRVQVAAYAGSPGWDFQYLRNAMSRAPGVKLQWGVLSPLPPPPADSGAAAPPPRLPLTPAQILEQDVLVLSDVPVAALGKAQWEAVNELARDRGGSVILLAGPSHLPQEYYPPPRGDPAASLPWAEEGAVEQASALLPFDPSRFRPAWLAPPTEQPSFRFVPTDDGRLVGALQLGDGPEGLRRWEQLPGVFRFVPVPQQALQSRSGRPLLVEVESRSGRSAAPEAGRVGGKGGPREPLYVMTEHRPGAGRVLFLGTNETWRWRYRVGERDQDRFWLQLIRYAADEPYAVEGAQGMLALDADKVSAEPGEPVRVRARILGRETVGGGSAGRGGADYGIQILRNGAEVGTSKLTAVPAKGDGRYETTVSGLQAGRYLLRLAVPGTAESLEMPLILRMSPEPEMADVSGDQTLLRNLAASSGGEFLTLDQAGRLPDRLNRLGDKQSRFVELTLWDSPLLFVFVVGCLGAEWALRKRFGLA